MRHNNTTKKILSLVISIVIILSLLQITSQAGQQTQSELFDIETFVSEPSGTASELSTSAPIELASGLNTSEPVAMAYGESAATLNKPSFELKEATNDPISDVRGVDLTPLAVDTSWYNPSAAVYYINDADQLAGLAQLVNGGVTFYNKIINLMSNISLVGEWTPIGNIGSPFRGIFNGGGHSITNLRITGDQQLAGLFGYVSDAAVENIHLETAFISVASTYSMTYAGGIAGFVSGNSTIYNCHSKGSISANNAGGLIGTVSGFVFIENCSNASAVSADYAGGIVGLVSGTISIRRASNTGDISASSVAGGISGYILKSPDDSILIEICYNTGAIIASGSYFASTGGICGIIYGIESNGLAAASDDVTKTEEFPDPNDYTLHFLTPL
ncbi:MAG: hypothetical protein FWH55_03735 [Oscillospiraceae bacterium]|nr:hypothetical protein [Oscillospiraceae bacterium]